MSQRNAHVFSKEKAEEILALHNADEGSVVFDDGLSMVHAQQAARDQEELLHSMQGLGHKRKDGDKPSLTRQVSAPLPTTAQTRAETAGFGVNQVELADEMQQLQDIQKEMNHSAESKQNSGSSKAGLEEEKAALISTQ